MTTRIKNWKLARRGNGEQSNWSCSGRRCLGVGAPPYPALLHTLHTHRRHGRAYQTHTMRTRRKRTRVSSKQIQDILEYNVELKRITGPPLLRAKACN